MALFENFPYTDFHNLNMDWIIKIAKDFLDQYTHIQEIIEQGKIDIETLTANGIDQLQEKETELENALDAWYNEHSEDIANQLAQALADLNDWYTEHQGFLDDDLQDALDDFQEGAEERARIAEASIPSDYSDFYDSFIGNYITDSWFTTNNITDCADIPPGMYAVYLGAAGRYNFPSALGQSFVMRATQPNPQAGRPYRYKLIVAFGNNGYACYAVWGSSNPPTWREISEGTVTQSINNLKGQYLSLEEGAYDSFLQIAPGNYLISLETAGNMGFPVTLGKTFYLIVSNKRGDDYAFKSFLAFGNSRQAYYTMANTSSTINDPPIWNSFNCSGGYLSENDMDSMGFTSYLDIPAGSYFIYLNYVEAKYFPADLGLSFYLEVSSQTSNSSYAFKTYKAYGNNGNAKYCVCGRYAAVDNLPRWYNLTVSEVVSGFTPRPLFDKPLGTCKLLLLGDSITRGSGASGLSGTEQFTTSLGTQTIYTEGNSWAVKLTTYLASQYPNIEVINHGWSGISINTLANKIDEFVPDGITHCILGLGVNSEGSTSFDGGITSIVEYLESKQIKVLPWTSWVGTHPNQDNINTAGRVQAALIHAYQKNGYNPLTVYSIAMDYLDEHNMTVDDVLEQQPGDEDVHPNDPGHDLLYRIIRNGFGF